MSAAVRPTAVFLRRTRHLPVTQCIARRWQTTAGKPATYDEMLELMEAEYPNPKRRQSQPLPNKEREKAAEQYVQRQQQQQQQQELQPAQEQHNPPDAPSGPSTTYQPITVSDPPSDSTLQPRRTGRNDAPPQPRYKSVNIPKTRSPRMAAQDAYKPRRLPPPMYKASSGQVDHDQAPEKPTQYSSPSASQEQEQSQAAETLDSLSSLDPTEPAHESSPTPAAEVALRSADAKGQDLPPAKARIPGRLRTPVAATAIKKPSIDVKAARTSSSPAEKGYEEASSEVRRNPLETIRIKDPRASASASKGQIFDNIFLRDSCTCAQCVDKSTRQKRFDSADIPSNIRIGGVRSRGTNDVILTWKHDVAGFGPEHTTILPYSWLKRTPYSPVTHAYEGGKHAWTYTGLTSQMKTFDYNEYMSDDKALFDLLQQLQSHGIAFIKDLPEAESSVIQTANRIGPLKNTFYGETWDVRSVSNAKNVAYTDVHLGFHMDLLYMQQPPRLQLLHCLRASREGGVSLFSDSYKAMQQLYELDESAFWALVRTPVNFHYDNDNHHYFRSRRTFQLREGVTEFSENLDKVWNYMEAVNWAPPFQAPFNHTKGDVAFAKSMREWHEAAQIFRDLTEINNAVYRRQMKPGECVIFDNRRILHARTAFAGGERWLRGAYLDDDPYLSKMRVLERKYKNAQSVQAWAEPAPGV
jgi:gamma-butyrobetaine dioxygenase